MTKQQRMIRILYYVGTPEWIQSHLKTNRVQGELVFPQGRITETNCILRPETEADEHFSDGSPVAEYETLMEMVERRMNERIPSLASRIL